MTGNERKRKMIVDVSSGDICTFNISDYDHHDSSAYDEYDDADYDEFMCDWIGIHPNDFGDN